MSGRFDIAGRTCLVTGGGRGTDRATGLNVVKPTDAVTLADWERILRVNLTGVFLCSQAAARIMRRQAAGWPSRASAGAA